MDNISQLWNKIQTTIINSPRQTPSTLTIPRDHIDENQAGGLDWSFKKDQHYFQVIINEMFLVNSREWFRQIDPVVYIVSEFIYNGKEQVVPFIVGPGLVKRLGVPDELNSGILLRNTNVSGLRPYRGGGLTLTIVLCQSNNDLLRPLLDVIESISGALDFSPVLGPYLKIANVLMDGFQMLYNSNGVTPIVGLRDSFGPTVNIPFQPGYYALIDAPDIDPMRLWVVDRQLMTGESLAASKPFRSADYVLYSISNPVENTRDDIDTLPFGGLWERVKKEAATPVDDPDYKNAKVLMVNLFQDIVISPDLTETQADSLADKYKERMQAIHNRAVSLGTLGAAEEAGPADDRQAEARKNALDILDL
jgi:hypothetical protein